MSWKRYAAERVVAAVCVVLLTLVAIFVLFRSGLSDLRSVTGVPHGSGSLGEEAREFASQLVHGSLGSSAFDNANVTRELLGAASVSAAVALGGLAFGAGLGIPIGLRWARRRRRTADSVRRAAIAFVAVLAPVLIWVQLALWVGFEGGLAPTGGYCDAFAPEILEYSGRRACGGFAGER